MDRRIQKYDRKRWFALHCCRSVVKTNPLPAPDIFMGLGLVMTGLIAILAIGALAHFIGAAPAFGAVALANAVPVGIQELQGKLDHILGEYKELKESAAKMETKYGSLPASIAEQLGAMQKQLDAIDVKLAEKHVSLIPDKDVFQMLAENEGLQKYMKDRPSHSFVLELDGKQSRQLFERKTTIDSAAVGIATSGVLQFDRTPGIVREPRRKLFLRDLLTGRPTTLGAIDFIKVNAAPARASMQTESSAKVENAVTFTIGTANVRTIATWIPASKQVLDDMTELMAYLQTALPYAVSIAEEAQMLTGSGTGQDLNGLVTQATAFNTALNTYTPGWKKQDIIARAIQQVEIAQEVEPSFVAMHPTDFWDIALTKDTQGRYLNSGPYAEVNQGFWGLTPVRSVSMGAGNFLVGSGNPAAVEIRDRMGMTLEIAAQHSDYFTKNMIAIRCERRLALPVYRPGSFIQGTLNTSP